ncbi:AAA-like domain-containing protein [Bdellovibrio bacteriovorus]|uniref:AAA-like domain-containing protein n=1 Tax=Bdellovibrio bacteriovorus TaxID=959 RepID=UPI0035A8C01C
MIRKRILHPTTIIPPELYVEREADRQLIDIISHAGRPGYILVSRQMGKTNLLLHVKQKMENIDNIFVYVDLSVKFDNASDCFRNIVETLVATHPFRFSHYEQFLAKNRSLGLPPHKEHEAELLFFLKQVREKIVIILDEVDSLKTSSFSDQIFAQIRSIYFSRINYPQFKNLTYVLSGVAEPVDLIKNKDISPFNIGEKIYLDDFSVEEFRVFLSKAKLNFKEDVVTRIYYWTQGNPRITWDICAALELVLLKGGDVTPARVDEEVTNFYLRQFNVAPIDHIRTLVSENIDLRNAITVIRFNKGDSLSDEVKSKLYLAGIINSPIKGDRVEIKNPVIDLALSDEWLNALEGAIPINEEALNKYAAGQYISAIPLFEKYLASSNMPYIEEIPLYMALGISYLKLHKFQQALDVFKKVEPDFSTAAQQFNECVYYQALCDMKLGKNSEAEENLKRVISGAFKEYYYYAAKVDYGYLVSLHQSRYDDGAQTVNSVIEEIESNYKSSPVPESYKDLLAKSLYIKSEIDLKRNRTNDAVLLLERSRKYANPVQKAVVDFGLVSLDVDNIKSHLRNIRDVIIGHGLDPDEDEDDFLSFSKDIFKRVILEAYKHDKFIYNDLITYRFKQISKEKNPSYIFFDELIDACDPGDVIPLSLDILSRFESEVVDKSALLSLYRMSIFSGTKTDVYFQKYFSLILQEPAKNEFNDFDIVIFLYQIESLIRRDRVRDAAKLSDTLAETVLESDENTSRFFPLVSWSRAQVQNAMDDVENAIVSAELAAIGMRKLIAEKKTGMVVNAAHLQSRLNAIEDFLSRFRHKKPVINQQRKLGRNELVTVKYHDGTIVTDKFKRLETDIIAQKCDLISLK